LIAGGCLLTNVEKTDAAAGLNGTGGQKRTLIQELNCA